MQLKRMIDALNGPRSYFFVHVDANTSIKEFRHVLKNDMNHKVFFTKRVKTSWGSFGLVEATLLGIRQILKSGLGDYIILLSGQDYPIKPRSYIEKFFEKNRDRIFIGINPIPKKEWLAGGITRFPDFEEISKHIQFYGGSQWWAMPVECCREIMIFIRKSKLLVSYFKTVFIPDESFFHTCLKMICKSDSNQLFFKKPIHYIDWVDDRPRTLTITDFAKIATSNKLFARKFDMNVDSQILKRLDEHRLPGL
ncbi:MAG: hypothetical protein J7502_06805 [Flavisolibacter sp.]|nr:hypothetical protein [Flavisolibacter sp.]